MKALKAIPLVAAAIAFFGCPLLRATSPDCIYYIDSNQNVDELRFNGSSWTLTNLMTATSATSAATESRLTAHLWSNSDNVWYVGTDSHIHELAYYGSPASWHTADVTSLASGPDADADSPLTSHVNGSSDNVFYVAAQGDIHELSFNGSTWTDTDITYASGAPQPTVTGADNLTGVVNGFYDYEDTFFVANGDINVITLTESNSTWSTYDINSTSGGYPPYSGGVLTSHMYRTNEEVYYIETYGDLASLVRYAGTTNWDTLDVTANDSGSLAPGSGTSPVTGYQNGNYDDIYFVDSSPGVYLDWYNTSQWLYTNVTSAASGSAPDSSRGMVGHMWENTTPEVHCFLSNGDVYEYAYYSNAWHGTDLSSIVSAPAAKTASPILAFTGI